MLTVEAKTVREALMLAAETGADEKLLRGTLVFVNGKPLAGAQRFRYRLSDGDEVALLSPAGGG